MIGWFTGYSFWKGRTGVRTWLRMPDTELIQIHDLFTTIQGCINSLALLSDKWVISYILVQMYIKL